MAEVFLRCLAETKRAPVGDKDRPTMPYSTPAGEEDLEYVSEELPDPKRLGKELLRTAS